MRFKKYFIFLFILISVLFSKHFIQQSKKGTYIKFLSKKKFYLKNKNVPAWANEQIERDFISVQSISQKDLNATFCKIKENASFQKDAFFRYRIIDNKLFKYVKNQTCRSIDFEKAVLTLLKIVKVPDIDFIYTDLDGLPSNLVEKDFYITNDQAPILCHAKIKNSKDLILIPDHNSYAKNWHDVYMAVLNLNDKFFWEGKKNSAFWRGGTTDQEYNLENYKTRPRVIISLQAQKYPDLIDAGITPSWFMRLKEIMQKENLVKPYADLKTHLNYKYLPVLDGAMCTYPGYQWRLLSNSLCLKQKSDQVQWFYLALRPNVHYIEIENDLSDLIEKITWAIKNDRQCRKMAENATQFAINNLSLEDIYVYFYQVLLKYERFQTFDKKFLKNDLKNNSSWKRIEKKFK